MVGEGFIDRSKFYKSRSSLSKLFYIFVKSKSQEFLVMCSRKKVTTCPPITKDNVLETLQILYNQKVVPMETRHLFEQFHNPPLKKGEFVSVPLVLFLGQYSVGKTTMIKYLLGKEYPGSRIGPDPTTDTFTVVHYDETEHEVMGPTLLADPTKPFQCLSTFGSAFSTRVRGAAINSPLLKHMTLIDTPGILSGDNRACSRGYNFATVSRFIADKVDLIILLFDISRLDISDEFKFVMQNIRGNEEKIKIVLNKADSVDTQHLTRVRGALMWMLSKVISTPEVPRVYVCSFSDEIASTGVPKRFHSDYNELFDLFQKIPGRSVDRKVNDIIKRAKQVMVHALIMDQCMKGWFRKSQKNMINALKAGKLARNFHFVRIQGHIPESDMPLLELFQQRGQESNVDGWHKINKKLMIKLQEFINVDIPRFLTVMDHHEDPTPSLKEYFHHLKSPLKIKQKKRSQRSKREHTKKEDIKSVNKRVSSVKNNNDIKTKSEAKAKKAESKRQENNVITGIEADTKDEKPNGTTQDEDTKSRATEQVQSTDTNGSTFQI